jgi:hypothetical protein
LFGNGRYHVVFLLPLCQNDAMELEWFLVMIMVLRVGLEKEEGGDVVFIQIFTVQLEFKESLELDICVNYSPYQLKCGIPF